MRKTKKAMSKQKNVSVDITWSNWTKPSMWSRSPELAARRVKRKLERMFPNKLQTASYLPETGKRWGHSANVARMSNASKMLTSNGRKNRRYKKMDARKERAAAKIFEKEKRRNCPNDDKKTKATSQEKKMRWKRQIKPRTATLIVKSAQERSYADVLDEIHPNYNLGETGTQIKSSGITPRTK